ncbi:MAG TPA: type 4a pilus biogenesis protein PilO [Myxococcota bacterium]|nr:type 4a pilus biogenesis protein PilO [Myxococcota bacterium]
MELSPEITGRLEQFSKLPRAARIGTLAGIVAILGAGYFFGFYQARMEELSSLNAKELELQRKLTEVRSIAANIAAFEAEIAELEVKLSAALRQLPNEQQLDALLTDISNLGKTAGIEIKSFRREDELVHDFYAEVPISVSFEGRYHDIAHFFDLVAKLPRIVNMGAINMSVLSQTSLETRLKVTGKATAFRFVGNGKG